MCVDVGIALFKVRLLLMLRCCVRLTVMTLTILMLVVRNVCGCLQKKLILTVVLMLILCAYC